MKRILALVLGFAPLVGHAQMVTGKDMKGFATAFRLVGTPIPGLRLVKGPPGGVLAPGEEARFLITYGEAPRPRQVVVEAIPYGTKGQPGDIWTPTVVRLGPPVRGLARTTMGTGILTAEVTLPIPERKGGYALIAEVGDTRQFLGSVVRTFAFPPEKVQYPTLSLDDIGVDVLKRLGVHAIRWGLDHKPTTDEDFPRYLEEKRRQLKAFKDANITVLAMVMGGDWYHPKQPMGRPRPWLNDKAEFLDTKFDLAWMPSYDEDFRKFVKLFAREQGWPNGPITAFCLWNEPWEGISISGWGADMIRYREMYTEMANGVLDARREAKVDVLVGGLDSSSNAFDKLFADGSNRFLPVFDFLAVHYQGMNSFASYRPWRERKGEKGRVRIWDTESWVANTDDRVAAVIAANRACGYDRAMGVYGGNIAMTEDGRSTAWSTASAVGAAVHFIGNRPFRSFLHENGLPWIMVFDGVKKPDDGTVVVVGDLGEAFGARNLPFRTARGLAEQGRKEKLWQALRSTKDPAEQAKLRTQIEADEVLSGASLSIPSSASYGLFDFYGNPVPVRGSQLVVPLDGRGFFLRANGSAGSFNRLLTALRSAKVTGIAPVAVAARDFTAPVGPGASFRVELTNVTNREVIGTLGTNLTRPVSVRLKPGEVREYRLPAPIRTNPTNTYPLTVTVQTNQGTAKHWEDLHANVIARRTPVVDGDLRDWEGVLPLPIIGPGSAAPSLTEAAWFPFKTFSGETKSGVATGYVAADDRFFYFASKVADDTPDPGMIRIATRDDDQFFYPEVSVVKRLKNPQTMHFPDTDTEEGKEVRWPAGVRRYSYRKDPFLPAGNAQPWCDNVQIAFNVLPPEKKPYLAKLPGTPKGFVNTQCTDYEFALNPVAPAYGGGTELWRLRAPDLPHKHFYPRQPKAPGEGPVAGGVLSIRREGNTILTECAIPWSAIPEVAARRRAGLPVKFSFRVNNNVNGTCMEWSRRRSVAKSGPSFMVDWTEHWANEVEFGWGR